MRLGDRVRSVVALLGIPAGSIGSVKEIGSLFIVVEFEDGRIGYYALRQLRRLNYAGPTPEPPPRIELGFSSETVPAGSHLCLLPVTCREMAPTAFDFLAAGLTSGEKCLCVSSPRWAAGLRRRFSGNGFSSHLESGDLVFVDPSEVYLPANEFTADRQLQRLARAIADLGARRMRIFARAGTWFKAVPEDEWWDYEMRATRVLGESGTTAICAYHPEGQERGCRQRAEVTHPYLVTGRRLSPGWASPV